MMCETERSHLDGSSSIKNQLQQQHQPSNSGNNVGVVSNSVNPVASASQQQQQQQQQQQHQLQTSPLITAFSIPSTSSCQPGLSPPNQTNLSPALLAEYQQRLQLYDYATQAAVRLRLNHTAFIGNVNVGQYSVGQSHHPYAHPVFGTENPGATFGGISPFARYDPRFRFIHEEPKPQHSYIGLIAMAILSSTDKKMVLSDIYQYILDNYPYFRNRGPGWRNSIRHNLSLNDCFIKAGRSANGKGHYWAIHPANIDDFKKGDFRRRKAQRKVRKHMGLSVPEDDDSPSPTPTPTSMGSIVASTISASYTSALLPGAHHGLHKATNLCPALELQHELSMANNKLLAKISETKSTNRNELTNHQQHLQPQQPQLLLHHPHHHHRLQHHNSSERVVGPTKGLKRQFDVESLLAPDSTVSDASGVERSEKLQNTGSGIEDDQISRISSPANEIGTGEDFGSNRSSPASFHQPQPQIRQLTHFQPNCESQQAQHVGLPGNFPWPIAQIQSLQNLQQINAGLLNQSLRVGFPSWAIPPSAFRNPENAANLLGYTAFTAANALVNKINEVPVVGVSRK